MSQSLIFSPLFLFQFPALEIRLGTQQLSKFLADWGAGSPHPPPVGKTLNLVSNLYFTEF